MPSMEDRRVLDLPLERAWKIGKNSFEILPQLMPEYFESIDLEEGDGGPGSVFVLTMGPGMIPPSVVFSRFMICLKQVYVGSKELSM